MKIKLLTQKKESIKPLMDNSKELDSQGENLIISNKD